MDQELSIKIESPSEKIFETQYPEIIKILSESNIEYVHQRDLVSFGLGNDIVIIGLVFVYNAMISGMTWDVIKQMLENIRQSISSKQKGKVYVYFENNETKERIEISINNEDIDEIELKNKLKIKFKE